MAKSGFAKQHLKSFIERIERLNEEREALSADIREVFSEAKGQGFDTKIMRKVIALRKLDSADRQEMEAMLDLYKGALGMDGTPLGDYSDAILKSSAKPNDDLPPHNPETGEIVEQLDIEDGIPKPATEAAAVIGAETAETKGSLSVTDRTDDAVSGDGMASAPMHANVSEDVTAGRVPAPNYDLAENLPAFLRREKPRVLELA